MFGFGVGDNCDEYYDDTGSNISVEFQEQQTTTTTTDNDNHDEPQSSMPCHLTRR